MLIFWAPFTSISTVSSFDSGLSICSLWLPFTSFKFIISFGRVFAITDILESNSEIIALGNRTDIIEKTNKLENDKAFLPGVVSRKKQMLPIMQENA